MKTITLIICFLSIGYLSFGQNFQNINSDRKNAISFSFGYDFGAICEIDYHTKLKTGFNSWINLEFSSPLGENNFDDFKTKFGIDIEAFKKGNFQVFTSLKTGYKRYNTELARFNAIGSNLGLCVGLYNAKWYFAGEFGYNNSATFHIKHSDAYKEIYPDVKDGHYFLTGSYLNYGIKGGITILKSFEVYGNFGMISSVGKDSNALLPFYAQLGLSKSF